MIPSRPCGVGEYPRAPNPPTRPAPHLPSPPQIRTGSSPLPPTTPFPPFPPLSASAPPEARREGEARRLRLRLGALLLSPGSPVRKGLIGTAGRNCLI